MDPNLSIYKELKGLWVTSQGGKWCLIILGDLSINKVLDGENNMAEIKKEINDITIVNMYSNIQFLLISETFWRTLNKRIFSLI